MGSCLCKDRYTFKPLIDANDYTNNNVVVYKWQPIKYNDNDDRKFQKLPAE